MGPFATLSQPQHSLEKLKGPSAINKASPLPTLWACYGTSAISMPCKERDWAVNLELRVELLPIIDLHMETLNHSAGPKEYEK